ncbi:MAG: ATP synthase F0 subunit B [Candidatus Eremiobacteraeota bacterium]|nr:ATP synthase F0 subunit B [Candidatus Eremiobacteraeota bacterium]
MGFLSLDGTFWLQLINFAIFFAILKVVFLNPVGRAVAKRRAYMDSLVEGADSAQANLRELQARIEGKRATARREAEAAIAKSRADASNEAARIATEYNAKVQDIVKAAERTVSGEMTQAEASLEVRASELAEMMLDRTLVGGNAG